MKADSFTLARSADTGFTIIRLLGKGGQGVVDHIRCKLSLKEFAVSLRTRLCSMPSNRLSEEATPAPESVLQRQRGHSRFRE